MLSTLPLLLAKVYGVTGLYMWLCLLLEGFAEVNENTVACELLLAIANFICRAFIICIITSCTQMVERCVEGLFILVQEFLCSIDCM